MAIHTKFFKSKLQETTTITFNDNDNDKDNDKDNDNNNKDTSIYFSMLPDYDHGDINVYVIDDETKCIIFKCFSVVEEEDEESSPSAYEYDFDFPH